MVERKRANKKVGLLVKSGTDECPIAKWLSEGVSLLICWWRQNTLNVTRAVTANTTRISEGLSVWLNNISPHFMGSASGIREATEVNPKGDLAVGRLQKWGPQEFNSPAFHQHYLISFPSFLLSPLCEAATASLFF